MPVISVAIACMKRREAAGHLQMIADPPASAISRQFPEKFAMRQVADAVGK